MSGKSNCGLERCCGQNTVVPDFIDLLLKSGKCFIQVTGGRFFAWRTGRGQNVELVRDGGQQRFRFLPQVIEEPWLYSMPA